MHYDKVNPPMSEMGQKAECLPNGRMSAFASSSGHTSARAFSSFVPKADPCTAPNQFYSISWSARRRKDSEIVSPSALAVLRLMISSNFVGCWMGRSEGLAPFKILST